eukprot:2633438-Pleurochrysis_carterae.AAC.1
MRAAASARHMGNEFTQTSVKSCQRKRLSLKIASTSELASVVGPRERERRRGAEKESRGREER